MKKKIFFILFILILGIAPVSAENLPSAPSPTTNSSEEAQRSNDPFKTRSELLQKATEKPVEEKAVETSEAELEKVKLEKQSLQEINAVVNREIETLKKNLDTLKNKENNSENYEKISLLEKELERKNLVIQQNQKAIEELASVEELRKYTLAQNVELKKELEEKNKAEWWSKIQLLFWITVFFLMIYSSRLFVSQKFFKEKKLRKKYAHTFNSFDVFLGFAYLIFLVWFIFHSNPSAVVYVLFLLGGIVIALQEFIMSLVSSLFIIREYAIGDIVSLRNGQRGIIEKTTMLKVHLRRVNEKGMERDEMWVIPNSAFVKQEVVVSKKSNVEKGRFEIVLPDDLPMDTTLLLKRLEKEILEPLITIKSYDAISEKRPYYDIQLGYNASANTTICIFWTETHEKNALITQKIWQLVNDMKKEILEKK